MTTTIRKTDYASLGGRMGDMIDGSLRGDYAATIASLLSNMREQFPALIQESNPVVARLREWSQPELAFIIQEYSGFSNAAIHMFLEARIRNHWPALTQEIVRNLDEEMGALTRGVPHLELMRHGYRTELGIETDGLQYSAMTEDFIKRMHVLFRHPDNMYLAGVLLAFEGTAVDEFRVVDRILRRYKELTGGAIVRDSLTGEYIAGHVVSEDVDPANDPEMDHYRGLVDAVRANVRENREGLVRGFYAICLELNRWWEQVSVEALQKSIREELAFRNGEAVVPYFTSDGGASYRILPMSNGHYAAAR